MPEKLLEPNRAPEPISLLVTLDKHYVPQLLVLLTSIYLNNPGEEFQLYLMHNNLPKACRQRIAVCCRKFGYSFYPIAVPDELFQQAPTNSRYPKEMYYRLLAAQLLPEQLERILYLDPDTLVINPLRPLWQTDMQGELFAAAAHVGKTDLTKNVNKIRLKTPTDYYNSGVLLLNLSLGRQEIVPAEVFRFVEEHEKTLLLPDQDVLNAMYGRRIVPLEDVIWNYDARNYGTYMLRSEGLCDINWVLKHTAILHFCGKAKPWKPHYIYRFGALYLHYMQLAERMLNA